MPLQPPENPSREQLPRTLFPAVYRPLRETNPDELNVLALQPQVLKPLPDGLTEAERARLMNLTPFRGWTEEGRRKSLGNLPRSVKMAEAGTTPVVIPEGMPQPPVTTAIPTLTPQRMLEGKYARRVLSKEEYDLYCHTWVKWLTDHPEWNKAEDLDDLQTICMETVLQHRLQQIAFDKPGLDNTEAVNASFKRKQKARENLTARRVDKVGTKANQGATTFNIAVVSGQIPPEEAARRKLIAAKDVTDELDFLENTARRPQQTINQPTEDEGLEEPTNEA